MTVRLRLALTVFVTGLATALGVMATVVLAFQRFEHESTYQRADAFLARVVQRSTTTCWNSSSATRRTSTHFLRSLLLFDPDSQLYLLDAAGPVLASTGRRDAAAGLQGGAGAGAAGRGRPRRARSPT